MPKFSKSTTLRLNSHLGKLKNSTDVYELNLSELKNKNFHKPNITMENRNVARTLLIKSVFLNLKILSHTRSSFLIRLLLKTEKVFVDKKSSKNSDLLQIIANGINKIEQLLILIARKLSYCLNYFDQLSKKYTRKWYIYLTRFFIVTILNIIPFIQITTRLVYPYPAPHIANAITNHLFDIFPVLLRIISITGKYVNNETYSFVLLGVYYHLFMTSPKTYNISTKISFQGTFSLMLMLLNHCIPIANEIVTILCKFLRYFFFLHESQNMNLLRDDMQFFVRDLVRFKRVRNRILGEKFYEKDSLYKILKITDALSLVSFLSVIALLYNYVYFIIRGKKPFIPVITKTVQRMMVDDSEFYDRGRDEL